MNILIATDKFKGCLTAAQVCDAIGAGINKAGLPALVTKLPMADGGDGSLAIITQYKQVQKIDCKTTDPLAREITAHYLTSGDTAYVELAVSSGIALLAEKELNPLLTSTAGTGILIRDAIARGARTIYLFLGGSCTTDAGLGIAGSLGVRYYDKDGIAITATGGTMEQIATIDTSHVPSQLAKCNFYIVCDVTNPLYGPEGAAHVYSPQKGASPQDVAKLDDGLRHVATLLDSWGHSVAGIPGTGAAGGVAAGMVALLGAEIVTGSRFFTDITDLRGKVASADLVITGEGKVDYQSTAGKVVHTVSSIANKSNIPVLAVCGVAAIDDAQHLGLQAIYSVRSLCLTDHESITTAYDKLVAIGETIAHKHVL